MTDGKFADALAHFQYVLRALVLVDVSRTEVGIRRAAGRGG